MKEFEEMSDDPFPSMESFSVIAEGPSDISSNSFIASSKDRLVGGTPPRSEGMFSDRDPRFSATFFKEMCCILGIEQDLSTVFSPSY